ncbi:MAG: ribosome biogenesis GTPase Der, partial [Nitrospinota bacterium]
MRKPVVSIVGRPNVGKSTLFNKIIGRRKAIVEDTPGVTRDRNYEETSWNDCTFDLIDTGGFEPTAKEDMLSQMRSQTQLAVEESDVIIFLCDGKEGLMHADEEAINLLRKFHKPILPAVNKIDDPSHENRIYDFAGLGFGEIIPVSAEHKLGISDLMDKVTDCLAHLPKTEPDNDLPGEDTKIAIIGRPNVGKSTLINQILKEKRLMVSPVPGTTRDPIDTRVEIDGKRYIFTDTAGIRRKGRVSGRLEKYCVIMAKKAMERSDIALLMLDAKEGVTAQDSKIAGYAYEMGRGCIIVINKWDLVEKDHKTIEKYKDSVLQHMKYLSYAPVISLSSLTGQR